MPNLVFTESVCGDFRPDHYASEVENEDDDETVLVEYHMNGGEFYYQDDQEADLFVDETGEIDRERVVRDLDVDLSDSLHMQHSSSPSLVSSIYSEHSEQSHDQHDILNGVGMRWETDAGIDDWVELNEADLFECACRCQRV